MVYPTRGTGRADGGELFFLGYNRLCQHFAPGRKNKADLSTRVVDLASNLLMGEESTMVCPEDMSTTLFETMLLYSKLAVQL